MPQKWVEPISIPSPKASGDGLGSWYSKILSVSKWQQVLFIQGLNPWREGKPFLANGGLESALPTPPRGLGASLGGNQSRGRIRFYLQRTSSAERPSAHQIPDHSSSTLPNAGQCPCSPPHPRKSCYFTPSPNSSPSSPARGGYAMTGATGTRLLAASLGTLEAVGRRDPGQGMAQPLETSQGRQF